MTEQPDVVDYSDDWMNPPPKRETVIAGPRYPRFRIERKRRLDYPPYERWDVWQSFDKKESRDAEMERLRACRPSWQLKAVDELHAPQHYVRGQDQ